MNYRVVDREKYYRNGVFRHFSEDCKCSVSLTARIDVSELYAFSKQSGTKFYINFLYLIFRGLRRFLQSLRRGYRSGRADEGIPP